MTSTSVRVTADSLRSCLAETEFNFFEGTERGKVRDCYVSHGTRYLVTTDRLSCFDRIVTTVPYKGQVLAQLAAFWLQEAAKLIPTHLLSMPDPAVLAVRECEVLPVEVVVRGYLAGSLWRSYQRGEAVPGAELRVGLKEFQKLDAPIITPTTKDKSGGHDTPISAEELVATKVVAPEIWDRVSSAALRLFELGSLEVNKRGLLLADTKYEFGLLNGEVVLVDELHTLDSSRFWIAESYNDRFAAGEKPAMLDKEPVRQWLLEHGFSGDGSIPVIEDSMRLSLAKHYIDSAERIMGRPVTLADGDPVARVERALRAAVGAGSAIA